MILSAAMMLDWLADKHGIEAAAEAGERIERAVDKVYADGIKPMEFGGSERHRGYRQGGAGGAVGEVAPIGGSRAADVDGGQNESALPAAIRPKAWQDR